MFRKIESNPKRARTTSRAVIDALEPRRMLAVYDASDGLTDGPDTVLITTAAQFHRVTINGTAHTTGDVTVTVNTLGGNDVISVADTLTNSNILVNAAAGDDLLQGTTGNLDDAFENFQFLGGSGFDTVVADNTTGTENTATFRVQGSGVLKENPDKFLINWTGTENVSFRDNNNPNTVRFVNLGNITHLEVRMNGGSDFVRNFLEGQPGNVGTSFGAGGVSIDTGAGTGDKIDVDNSADSAGASFLINSSSVDVTSPLHNTEPLTYLNCETVNVTGSAHNDTFTVNRPPAANYSINAGAGNDAFTVGGGDLDSNGLLTSSSGAVVDGGGGTDSITFDDHLDAEGESENYFLGFVFGPHEFGLKKGSTYFLYDGVEAQVLNAADRVNSVSTPNVINMEASPGGTVPTTINGGANRKCDVNIGNGFDFDLAPVTANLQGGTVFMADYDSPTGIFRLTQTHLEVPIGAASKIINYSGVDTFRINGSLIAQDLFHIDGVPPGMAVLISGAGGDDRLTLGAGNVDTTILGPVTFDGGADPDTVTIDNSQDATPESHVLNGATFIDGQTHTFLTDELIINEGPGGTNFAVNATACATNINGGNANETFTVGGGDLNSNLNGTLSVVGFGGNDQLLINDLNDNTQDPYTIESDGLTVDVLRRQGIDNVIVWKDIQSVTLDASNAPTFAGNPSIITVNNALAPLRIRGNAGSDRIVIGDAIAPVFVHTGLGDADQLIVNSDSAPGDEPAVVVIDQTDDVDTLDIRQGGTLRVQSGAVLLKSRLNSPPGPLDIAGVLDLAGGALLSTAGGPSLETFRSQLLDGFHSGTWTGTSNTGAVNSSFAAASPSADGIGYALGAQLPFNTIGGFSIAAGDILLRHTLQGDVNLDQKVDITDLGIVATNWQGTNKVWTEGDNNYDATVDISDLGALATNWQQTLAAAGSPFSQRIVTRQRPITELEGLAVL